MHWRIAPWMRRLITRLCAITPAIILIALRGDNSVTDLLTLSQVVLAIQLPLAMFPLLFFAGSKRRMGDGRIGGFLLATGGLPDLRQRNRSDLWDELPYQLHAGRGGRLHRSAVLRSGPDFTRPCGRVRRGQRRLQDDRDPTNAAKSQYGPSGSDQALLHLGTAGRRGQFVRELERLFGQ